MRRILLLASVLLVSACQMPGQPAGGSASATPAHGAAGDTPITSQLAVPTPGQESGVATGMIYSLTAKAPLAGQAVYLGERVPLNPGPGYLVTVQQQSSPHAITDAQGRFVLAGIPPGDYPLLVWTPFNSYVVPDAKGEREMSVIIEAGKVTDLGKIEVDWP